MKLWQLTGVSESNKPMETLGKLIQLDRGQRPHDRLKYESLKKYLLAPALVIISKQLDQKSPGPMHCFETMHALLMRISLETRNNIQNMLIASVFQPQSISDAKQHSKYSTTLYGFIQVKFSCLQGPPVLTWLKYQLKNPHPVMGIQLRQVIYASWLFACSQDQSFPYLRHLITLFYRWSHPHEGSAPMVGGSWMFSISLRHSSPLREPKRCCSSM